MEQKQNKKKKEKVVIDPITVMAAASLMGLKGGAVKGNASDKKKAHMERLRQMRIMGLAGKKKGYRANKNVEPAPPDEGRIALISAREALLKKVEDSMREGKVLTCGQILGFMGGSAKSERKTASSRQNALLAGRKKLYKYDGQHVATVGRYRDRCIIPDEVAADPERFIGVSFAAYRKGKRINVQVVEVRDGQIHVHRRWGANSPGMKTGEFANP